MIIDRKRIQMMERRYSGNVVDAVQYLVRPSTFR